MDADKITLGGYIAYLKSMYQRYGNISITQLKHIERNKERMDNERICKVSPVWVSVKDKLPPVDKEAVVLTTDGEICFGHIVDKKIAKDYNGWNIPDVEYWLPFVDPKDKLL